METVTEHHADIIQLQKNKSEDKTRIRFYCKETKIFVLMIIDEYDTKWLKENL